MKLTKERLIQIIKEEVEMNELTNPVDGDVFPSGGEERIQSDVERISKLMSRIDNYKEYTQLFDVLLAHDWGEESRKKAILKIKRDQINKMLTGAPESPTEQE